MGDNNATGSATTAPPGHTRVHVQPHHRRTEKLAVARRAPPLSGSPITAFASARFGCCPRLVAARLRPVVTARPRTAGWVVTVGPITRVHPSGACLTPPAFVWLNRCSLPQHRAHLWSPDTAQCGNRDHRPTTMSSAYVNHPTWFWRPLPQHTWCDRRPFQAMRAVQAQTAATAVLRTRHQTAPLSRRP